MNIKPLNDRVLIQKDKPKEKVGSIILPTGSAASPYTGTIIGVGLTSTLTLNTRVIFSSFAGQPIPNDDTLLLLKESDIIGIIEEE